MSSLKLTSTTVIDDYLEDAPVFQASLVSMLYFSLLH